MHDFASSNTDLNHLCSLYLNGRILYLSLSVVHNKNCWTFHVLDSFPCLQVHAQPAGAFQQNMDSCLSNHLVYGTIATVWVHFECSIFPIILSFSTWDHCVVWGWGVPFSLKLLISKWCILENNVLLVLFCKNFWQEFRGVAAVTLPFKFRTVNVWGYTPPAQRLKAKQQTEVLAIFSCNFAHGISNI